MFKPCAGPVWEVNVNTRVWLRTWIISVSVQGETCRRLGRSRRIWSSHFIYHHRFDFKVSKATLHRWRQQTERADERAPNGMCSSIQLCSMRDGSKGCLKEVIKRSVTFPKWKLPPDLWAAATQSVVWGRGRERVGGLSLGSCTFLSTNSPNLHVFNGRCVHWPL